MLSIGFFEILVIAVLGLLVFGPEKLPDAIRTFAFGISKVKRSWSNTRRELEQELGMDEIRKEIHNAQIMEDLELIKSKTGAAAKKIGADLEESIAEESELLSSHAQPDQKEESEESPADEIEPPETGTEPEAKEK